MTTPFTRAQDAANVAYDMTLEQTGDEAQAADDYRAVMQAYDDAQSKRRVMVGKRIDGTTTEAVDAAWEPRPGWSVNQAVTNESAVRLADEKMAEYATWQESIKDWNDIKGDCAL